MSKPEAALLIDVPIALRESLWHTQAEHVLLKLHADNNQLRSQRDALLKALKAIEPILARMYGPQAADLPPMQIVRAAIAKAEEA